MSSLAEQALEHARQRLAGQRQAKQPTSKIENIGINAPTPLFRSLEVVVDGPINHFMFLEGRAWATDMVRSMRASAASLVIERLTVATAGRPGSYALGIKSIIDAIKGQDNG